MWRKAGWAMKMHFTSRAGTGAGAGAELRLKGVELAWLL